MKDINILFHFMHLKKLQVAEAIFIEYTKLLQIC